MWTCILQARSDPARVQEMVVLRYRRPLYEFARQAGLRHEDAEDVVQEAFFRICRDEFLEKADRSKGKFRSLLLAVVKYVISEFRRRSHAGVRDTRREVPLSEFDAAEPGSEDPAFNRLWVQNLVSHALDNLKEDPTIPSLRLQISGKSYRDIAQELGIPESTVTNNIHRAKVRVKKEIERLVAQYSTQAEFPEEIALLIQYL